MQDLRQQVGVMEAKDTQRLSELSQAQNEAQEKYKKILELNSEIDKLRK